MPRKQKLLPDHWRTRLTAISLRGLGGLFVITSAFMLFSLLSYAPTDPSFNTAAGNAYEVQNLGGAIGAYFADFALQSFRLAAILIPLCFLVWGIRLSRGGASLLHIGKQCLWLLLALITLSASLAGLSFTAFNITLWGGSVGMLLLNAAARLGDQWLGSLTHPITAAVLLLPALYFTASALGLTVFKSLGAFGRGLAWLWYSLFYVLKLILFAFGWTWHKTRRQDGNAATTPSKPKRRKRKKKEIAVKRGKTAKTSKRAESDKQSSLPFTDMPDYELPSLTLLAEPKASGRTPHLSQSALQKNAEMLHQVLLDYGIKGEITEIRPGPVVTLYELEPAPGLKSSRVINLADDIARSMSAISVRVAVVPGRNVIGIELPNKKREFVMLRDVLSSEVYDTSKFALPLVLGKDIGGQPIVVDLSRMPHLLVAGTTGSGKSVGVNCMLLSLLYRLPPEKCRMILIDPKMLELSVYDDIPHLLTPVVTDPRKAIVSLKWAVHEMEQRYRAMSKLGVRNIAGYNARLKKAREKGEVLTRRVQTGFDPDTGKPVFEDQAIDLQELPYIVIVVDEFADLMLVAGKEVEAAIQRLAQMARAAGIHMIMATQRPSVDVVTGTVKANFPTRISFQVTSKIDSRTILGEGGAENLLGKGDMLYMAGGGRVKRVHGAFVDDMEVESVTEHLRTQGEPMYVDQVTDGDDPALSEGIAGLLGGSGGSGSGDSEEDKLYDQAVAIVAKEQKASTSFIQRHLRIGYNRAARIIERMESEGVVSTANHAGRREVLVGQR